MRATDAYAAPPSELQPGPPVIHSTSGSVAGALHTCRGANPRGREMDMEIVRVVSGVEQVIEHMECNVSDSIIHAPPLNQVQVIRLHPFIASPP